MFFVWRYQQVYHGTNHWYPVGWIEHENELKGMAPGTYALHEGSESVIDAVTPEEVQVPLPTQLNSLGIRHVQTPEGIPDNAPVAGIVEMVVTKPRKPRKAKK